MNTGKKTGKVRRVRVSPVSQYNDIYAVAKLMKEDRTLFLSDDKNGVRCLYRFVQNGEALQYGDGLRAWISQKEVRYGHP